MFLRGTLSKSHYSTLRTIRAFKKKDLSIFCILTESASVLDQANRSYGGFKLCVFATKRGPVRTIKKIQPDILRGELISLFLYAIPKLKYEFQSRFYL